MRCGGPRHGRCGDGGRRDGGGRGERCRRPRGDRTAHRDGCRLHAQGPKSYPNLKDSLIPIPTGLGFRWSQPLVATAPSAICRDGRPAPGEARWVRVRID